MKHTRNINMAAHAATATRFNARRSAVAAPTPASSSGGAVRPIHQNAPTPPPVSVECTDCGFNFRADIVNMAKVKRYECIACEFGYLLAHPTSTQES